MTESDIQQPTMSSITNTVSLVEHLNAVEELTEAIRFTAEYTGQGVLKPIEGWSWYDALLKYAPAKAVRFEPLARTEENNPNPFVVMVIDEKVNMVIIEGAQTNSTGMNAILKSMTDLDQRQRGEFMRTLNELGSVEHLSRADTGQKYYSISVIEKKRFPVDGQYQFNRLRPPVI